MRSLISNPKGENEVVECYKLHMSPESGPTVFKWDETKYIGRAGEDLAYDLLAYLRTAGSWYRTVAILDFTEDEEFQRLGIDFIWCVRAANSTCAVTVEFR